VPRALAFVPAPLPRALSLEGSTLHLLAWAEHALGELSGVTARLVNPYLFGSPLLRREAILSSRIEGTHATAEQLAMFEAGSPPPDEQQRSDAREVLNYVEAMHLGLAELRKIPVSLRLIQTVHGRLLKGVRGESQRPGEFRTIQNYIGHKAEGIRGSRFVPPPVAEMRQALDELEKYLHVAPHGRPALGQEPDPTVAPLLVRLALVHYQFEAIHPFRDGNGRLGRLLIPLLLISHGRLREPLLYMSSYLERHRQAYYDLMLRVSQAGDWRAWIDFFLRGVAESARESVDMAGRLLGLRERWQERFQEARSSALLLKLIDHLFKVPATTIGRTAALLKVTPAAASHNIGKLVNAGVLKERTGRQRGQVFVAMDIVRIVESARTGRAASQPPGG